MEIAGQVMLYFVFFILGFSCQTLARLGPGLLLAVGFGSVLFLPPLWGLGLVTGSFLACAFFTYKLKPQANAEQAGIGWLRMMAYAALSFSGFLMTLVLVWKLKLDQQFFIAQREAVGWFFFALLEVCFYRILAYAIPSIQRFSVGYRMAFLEFWLILYWLWPMGGFTVFFVFCAMLLVSPLLLTLVDQPTTWIVGDLLERFK